MHRILIALFLFFSGCGDESIPAADLVDAEVGRGRKLFARNGCQTCHGAQGRGDGALAASLNPKPRDFRDRSAYKEGFRVEQIAVSIAAGLPPVMPGYSHLSTQSRRQLAQFIASLQVEPAAGPEGSGAADMRAEAAWVRLSLPPHQAAAAYMILYNDFSRDELLLSVEAVVAGVGIAGAAELHLMEQEGEMMTMRRIEQLTVPANGNIHLKPGGLHLMLTDLERPLLAGEQVEFLLRFQHARPLSVVAPVRALR